MSFKEPMKEQKIIGVTLMVFEGDIIRDENGHITNKLVETMHHEAVLTDEEKEQGVTLHALDEIKRKVIEGESWES